MIFVCLQAKCLCIEIIFLNFLNLSRSVLKCFLTVSRKLLLAKTLPFFHFWFHASQLKLDASVLLNLKNRQRQVVAIGVWNCEKHKINIICLANCSALRDICADILSPSSNFFPSCFFTMGKKWFSIHPDLEVFGRVPSGAPYTQSNHFCVSFIITQGGMKVPSAIPQQQIKVV